MPRKKRIQVAGALHHIMARGIEGRSIFNDDNDRIFFLDNLGKRLGCIGFKCYAWVLMSNHYHILIRTNELPLSELMRGLNSSYARYFGRKYNRKGYLFQDRYKSIATQELFYLKELVRYVHLNPIRAGIVKNIKELGTYRWCSHGVMLNRFDYPWVSSQAVLRRFGRNRTEALKQYFKFLKEGVSQSDPFSHLCDKAYGNKDEYPNENRLIGDREFILHALRSDHDRSTRRVRIRTKGWNLDKIAHEIVKVFGIQVEDLQLRGRNSDLSNARSVFAYCAYREFDIPVIEIARYLHISGPGISRRLQKGRELCKERGISFVDVLK